MNTLLNLLVLWTCCLIGARSQTLPENKVCYFSANGAWSGYTALRHEDGHTLDTCADLCETEPLCDRATFVMGTAGSNQYRCNLLQATVGGTTVGTADRQRIECKTTGFSDVTPDIVALADALRDWCTGVGTTRTDIEKLHGQIHYWKFPGITTLANLATRTPSPDRETCNPPIGNWDVSHVTSMAATFHLMRGFDQNLTGWDTSKVTDMRLMFIYNNVFNNGGDPGINNWDVSLVENMEYMFHQASRFNQPINDWNVASVISMKGMFKGPNAGTNLRVNMDFNQPLNKWNTISVTTMSEMFMFSEYNQDLSNFVTSTTTDLSYMFHMASYDNAGVPLTGWDTSKVTTMYSMFQGGIFSFVYNPEWPCIFNQNIDYWNTSSVLNMGLMFKFCTSFDQPLNSWDTSSVVDMQGMFRSAQVFNQNLCDWDISNVQNFNEMFSGANAYDQNLNCWAPDPSASIVSFLAGAQSFSYLPLTWQGFENADCLQSRDLVTDYTSFSVAGLDAMAVMNGGSCPWNCNTANTASCGWSWGTNSPTPAPGLDLAQDQDYVSPVIDNPSLTFSHTSGSYSFADYTFTVDVSQGSDDHTSTGWVREVKFAKCRTPTDLTSYVAVPDACSNTVISPVTFDTSTPPKTTLVQTLEWIQARESTCADITWNDGSGNDASLTWYVSYNAAKNLTVDDSNTQHYEYICVEREFTVSFNSELNAVATFESTERLVDVVQDVRVVSSKMNACPTAGEYELEYEVFMRLINNPADGLTHYMPYAVKPADSQCHYDAGDTALTSFSTSGVTALTGTDYLFTVKTGCRAIASGVCDAFQTCEGTTDSGIQKFSLNVNFKRGADTQAIMGLINIFITHDECVGAQDFGTQLIQAETDVWRRSNTATSGYELVDVTSGGTVSVNEDIFVVMFTTTDVYSGVKNTVINNYVDQATDGYRQEDNTECVTCSDEGCYGKNAVGTFGEFARTHYASATTDREHVYRHIVPTGVKSSITVNMTSTLTNECTGTSGRRLKASSRRLNAHDGVMTAEIKMNVLYRRGVLFSTSYDYVITRARDISDFLQMCNTDLKSHGVICENVAKDSRGRFMFVMSGSLSSIENASYAIITESVLSSMSQFDNSKVISLNAKISKDGSTYVYKGQENNDLSTDAIIGISIGGTLLASCLLCILASCCCSKNGYSKLE